MGSQKSKGRARRVLYTCRQILWGKKSKNWGHEGSRYNPARLTFWTVVVRSKQSWMILFFITEKSVTPVKGVLEKDKNYFRKKVGK